MMKTDFNAVKKRILEILGKNKYILLLFAVGVVLILIPSHGDGANPSETESEEQVEYNTHFSVENEERRLEEILSMLDGAGEVRVMLSVLNDGETVVASDSEISEEKKGADGDGEFSREVTRKTVILSSGSSYDDTVKLQYIYPEYAGAIIASQGADSTRIKLDITEAVSAITGLSYEKIKVLKMK